MAQQIKVPNIGDFKDVDVTELLVKPGDMIEKEQSLISVESDKATMEIPSPSAGRVKEVLVKLGDKVSEGTPIVVMEESEQTSDKPSPAATQPQAGVQPETKAQAPSPPGVTPGPTSSPTSAPVEGAELHAEILVLGSGPGGYTAAFRASDLGKKVVLVERYPDLGGVCTNVGCIPSKALLHAAKVLTEAEQMSEAGIDFPKPQIDIEKLRAWKTDVAGKGAKGIAGLAKQRKVTVVQGTGRFESPKVMSVAGADGKTQRISFDQCIIAAGSSVARIPNFPYYDPRLIDSTGALALADIPKRLLIIGGGIIGLEMACVYDALGSKITVVEALDGLMPGADRDMVRPLERRIQKRYEAILLSTKVTQLEATPAGLKATFEGKNAPEPQTYDRVLVAVGRRPNGGNIDADKAGVTVNERGFIPVDKQQRTNVPHIFAIGDVVGDPMLAHKATHEGKVAAEVACGRKAAFDAMTIPSVAYTDPEVAWMGLTETDAAKNNVPFEKAAFPWAASGRARAVGRTEGLTKLLFDPESKRLLGAAMVGPNAGELIAETVLALEMGADLEDISLTIHPHPTLSETPAFAAEAGLGSITDLYLPRNKA
ncbi:MAG TPA: dihydrolipoyl dehydrogenase [Burkholderiales bacterium]|nr:dihydrolipoyl dehydrogenase [Burkholderiales bacterium]